MNTGGIADNFKAEVSTGRHTGGLRQASTFQQHPPPLSAILSQIIASMFGTTSDLRANSLSSPRVLLFYGFFPSPAFSAFSLSIAARMVA